VGEMTPRRRVLAALMGGKVDRVPATCIGGCGGSVFCRNTRGCWNLLARSS